MSRSGPVLNRARDAISCAPFVGCNSICRARKSKESIEMIKNATALRLFILAIVLLLGSLSGSVDAQRRQQTTESTSATGQTDALKALQWRQVGPFRGGRSTAVTRGATQPIGFYFGATAGGGLEETTGRVDCRTIQP